VDIIPVFLDIFPRFFEHDKKHGFLIVYFEFLSSSYVASFQKCIGTQWYRTRDELAQARTHTQRHMNNVLSEMVILISCFVFYCSFSTWLYKQYGITLLSL
jgi:hypothetical protein